MQQDQRKLLIVNADDFGMSPSVNRGIIAGHTDGIVTSTSLMTRFPAAEEAADMAARHPRLSVGLHIDLGEWAYHDGRWQALYQVVDANDRAAVAAEVERQLQAFRMLLGREPTHLDSHQHVHRYDPAKSVVAALAERLRLPLRHAGPIRYCGDFYGQMGHGEANHPAITVDSLIRVLGALPAGATELACHPAMDIVDSPYSAERPIELRSLCDPAVRDFIASRDIRLLSFADWRTLIHNS